MKRKRLLRALTELEEGVTLQCLLFIQLVHVTAMATALFNGTIQHFTLLQCGADVAVLSIVCDNTTPTVMRVPLRCTLTVLGEGVPR